MITSFIISFFILKRRRFLPLFLDTITLLTYSLVIHLITKRKRKIYNMITPRVIEKLDTTKLKYHLAYGTFLFAYRDKSFADDDLDIAMFSKDFNKINAASELKKIGFTLKEEWGLDGQILEQCFKNEELKISMDLFVIPEANNLGYVFDEKKDRYGAYKHFPYTVKEYKVNDSKFLAPKEAEEYLKWHYGNWKVKDKNYHWFYGSDSNKRIIVNNANIEYKKY